MNRVVQVQFADGTRTLTGYDAAGRRVAETNQGDVVTRLGYDGAGRLVAVTNAFGISGQQTVTRYQYDEAGNQTAQIDALLRTNRFEYDNLGRRTRRTLPGSQSETFGYNPLGNLIAHTNFNGTIITNQYDVMNRLTNCISAGGYQVSYGYSTTGQRTNMVDAGGTTIYSYDNRDRLTNKLVSFTGGPSVALNYRYDANGNVTNLWSDTANGVTNFYQYDALSRLTNVLGRDDEPHEPTNARMVPMKINAGAASRLRTLLNEAKLGYSNSTSKRPAHLVALSRSTQERGFASLFHLSTPGSPSVMDATAPAMSLRFIPKSCHWVNSIPNVSTPTAFGIVPADYKAVSARHRLAYAEVGRKQVQTTFRVRVNPFWEESIWWQVRKPNATPTALFTQWTGFAFASNKAEINASSNPNRSLNICHCRASGWQISFSHDRTKAVAIPIFAAK